MIHPASIQEVLEKCQIDDVVRDFVTLQRRGSNLIGLCPFHNEKSPSFSVSPSKNIFKCFGCGKGGDSLHFVMARCNSPGNLKNIEATYAFSTRFTRVRVLNKYEKL